MTPAIEVTGLGKVFRKKRTIRDLFTRPFHRPGETRALDDVSLEVRPGEIFGLLGPNGAGKTTLLKILSCLVTPTTGSARVAGHDVAGDPYRVRAKVGLVTSDERSFYWRLSGRENLRFFAALYNVPRERARRRVQDLLEKVEMADRADQPFMEYSTGTKQRLAIARALLHDPPILYMDEPTRSLDPTAAKHLRTFVRETLNRAEGKSIILATHNLPEAESLCSRLAILHLAKVRRYGTVEEVRTWGASRERYLLTVRGWDPEAWLGSGAPAEPFPGCSISPVPAGEEAFEGRAAPAGGIASGGAAGDASRSASFLAEVDRGGEALTEMLRRLLAAGATVVSCSRREASLQEAFDLVAGDGAAEGEAPGAAPASAGAQPARAGRGR